MKLSPFKKRQIRQRFSKYRWTYLRLASDLYQEGYRTDHYGGPNWTELDEIQALRQVVWIICNDLLPRRPAHVYVWTPELQHRELEAERVTQCTR